MDRRHHTLDERSLDLHRQIAAKLAANPSLIERVRANLQRGETTVSPRTRPYLEQWQRLVDAGLDAVLQTAADPGERATCLRQCFPLAGILPQQARLEFLKRWRPSRET